MSNYHFFHSLLEHCRQTALTSMSDQIQSEYTNLLLNYFNAFFPISPKSFLCLQYTSQNSRVFFPTVMGC